MAPKPLEPVLVVHLFPEERRLLLELLGALRDEEWSAPTVCLAWSLKDVALHLLGDDLGRLSRGRDAFRAGGFVPKGEGDFESELLDFIHRWNELWVQATRRISPRLLCDLLRFAGEETQRYFESLDLFAIGGPVTWAGPDPAPFWLDIAREYTERWHHHQQIRDALGRPALTEPRLFAPVLETFVRALPHTFRDVRAAGGTHVRLTISGDAGGVWSLVRDERWSLFRDVRGEPQAAVAMDADTAWRLFTKGISREAALARTQMMGDRRLALKVFDTVSIIA
jgi:uncharacterized protein (TIGR03083 family)